MSMDTTLSYVCKLFQEKSASDGPEGLPVRGIWENELELSASEGIFQPVH